MRSVRRAQLEQREHCLEELEAATPDNVKVVFDRLSEAARDDTTLVLAAVCRNGLCLQAASKLCRNDSQIVLEAVRQDPACLRFASEARRDDRNIVLEAVRNDPASVRFAGEVCQVDEEIVLVGGPPDCVFQYTFYRDTDGTGALERIGLAVAVVGNEEDESSMLEVHSLKDGPIERQNILVGLEMREAWWEVLRVGYRITHINGQKSAVAMRLELREAVQIHMWVERKPVIPAHM